MGRDDHPEITWGGALGCAGVVRHALLAEDHAVPAVDKRLDQAAPEGGAPVPSAQADSEAKDDQLHARCGLLSVGGADRVRRGNVEAEPAELLY